MNELVPSLTVAISIAGIVLATGFRRGSLVSPFSVSLLMLGSIFGIRPLMMLDAREFSFYGLDIRGGFAASATIGLVGVASLVSGYFIASLIQAYRRPLVLVEQTPDLNESPRGMRAVVILAVLLLAGWLITMIVLGGGTSFLTLLFAGRSEAVEQRLAGLPSIVPAIPVAAALLVAQARITIERQRRLNWTESVQYWLLIVLATLPASALGTRRFIVPAILAALLGVLGPTWNKRITPLMTAGIVAAFLALAIFPFVRSAGSRTGSTDLVGAMTEYFTGEGLQGTLQGFFLSYDTEMFDYIAYLAPRLGQSLEFGAGRGTLGEILLAPIPASLLPYPTWSNVLLTEAFGGGCGEVFCPVPSAVGILYYDLALPGVVIGMLIIGLLYARFETAFLRAERLKLSLLLALASFIPSAIRGNTVSQLWILAQIVFVVWVCNSLITFATHRRPVLTPATQKTSALPERSASAAPRWPGENRNH